MRFWKIALVSFLTVALAVGVAMPALARPEVKFLDAVKAEGRLFKGEVVSVNATGFTIESDNRTTTFKVNDGTRFFMVESPKRALETLKQSTGEAKERIKEAIKEQKEQTKEQALEREHRELNKEQAKENKLEALKNRVKNLLPRGRKGSDGSGNVTPLMTVSGNQTELEDEDDDEEVLNAVEARAKDLPGFLKWLNQFGSPVSFADLKVGQSIAVWATPSNVPVAKIVLIIKASKPNEVARVAGTVTTVNETAKTIILQPETSDPLTFSYNDSTIFILKGSPFLKPGDKAQIVYIKQDNGALLAKSVQTKIPTPPPTSSNVTGTTSA